MKNKVVEGHVDLVRDNHSNAIVNTDLSEYNNYLRMRAKRKEGSTRIDNMESDLKNLKNDINEIKTLLRALSNG
tara:strand:+ start:134 stop:355 length:222 start_codon:yes stop_codon:yes gene_type:complete